MKVITAALVAVLTSLIFFFPVKTAAASAEGTRYAYANLGSQVYICAEKTADSALFVIPQTYCVEILGDEGSWYRVKYAEDNGAYRAINGYCLKNDLTEIAEPLENTYLNLTFKVTYKAETANSLFPPLEIELTAAYYGAYTLAISTLSYVYCGEKFGYVSQTVESYPLNDLPQPTVAEVTEPENNNAAMLVTALVITAIAAVAIIVLYFSSRKKPT